MPSQCAPLIEMNRSRRLVCAYPYGAIQSASTAAASMTTTITAPIVPSGLPTSIRHHTSIHHGRDAGRRAAADAYAPSGGFAAATPAAI